MVGPYIFEERQTMNGARYRQIFERFTNDIKNELSE